MPSACRSSCLPQFGKILTPPSLPPSSSCPCAPARPRQAPLHPSSPSSSAACLSTVPDTCAAGAGVPGGHGRDESTVVVGPVGQLSHIYDVRQMCAGGTEPVQWHQNSLKFITHALGCSWTAKAHGAGCVCAHGVLMHVFVCRVCEYVGGGANSGSISTRARSGRRRSMCSSATSRW